MLNGSTLMENSKFMHRQGEANIKRVLEKWKLLIHARIK